MSVSYKDYYKVLGVARSATKEEISKAYKKLARKYHPDLNANDKKAEERFKEVNEAHEVLKDPEKRKLYDQLGPDWENKQHYQRPPGFENMNFNGSGSGGFGASGFSDFFESIFGGGHNFSNSGSFTNTSNLFGDFSRPNTSGQNKEATLLLTLEEAFNGGKKSITLENNRSFEVSIPAGIANGAKIRLAGQGSQGYNGGSPGDLILKVKIRPHDKFTLEENNIIFDLSLAPWEAVLGCKLRVPTLSGDVELKISPGTSSGKKLRLRGKGLGSGAKKGDQYIRIVINSPEKISDEEHDLWKKLEEVSSFSARV